jgi:Rieske Fe-S protein
MTDVQTTAAPETDEIETAQACAACSHSHSSRRNVLLGAGAVGATAVLAACGTSTGGNSTGTDYSSQPAPAGSSGAQATGAGSQGTSGTTTGSTALAKTADVKVGGGVIKGSYVVTQPVAGTFKAFSTVCPHAGCNVNKIDSGVISCPCHGSQFSVKDGSVVTGPATQGLTSKAVKVDGANVVSA